LARLIVLLLLSGLVAYLFYRYRQLAVEKQKKAIRVLVLFAFFAVLFGLLFTGRLNWVIAVVGGLLPLLPRMGRFFIGAWPSIRPFFQRYQQNRQSSMHSRIVNLQIDMLSGVLQGEVLEGEFAGQKLQVMPVEQLVRLLAFCQQHDAQSAALLMAYMDREHTGWRKEKADSYGHAGSESAGYGPDSDTVMSQKQARDILGLSEDAGKKQIIKAHKHLMQKLHPDRGGSDYLARQINRARDTLLKND